MGFTITITVVLVSILYYICNVSVLYITDTLQMRYRRFTKTTLQWIADICITAYVKKA